MNGTGAACVGNAQRLPPALEGLEEAARCLRAAGRTGGRRRRGAGASPLEIGSRSKRPPTVAGPIGRAALEKPRIALGMARDEPQGLKFGGK